MKGQLDSGSHALKSTSNIDPISNNWLTQKGKPPFLCLGLD